MSGRMFFLALMLPWPMMVFGQASTNSLGFGAESTLQVFNFEKHRVFLEIDDQVKDGCLPTPSVIHNAYEVELRRLGFKVSESTARETFDLRLLLLGYDISANACVVVQKLRLMSPSAEVTVPTLGASFIDSVEIYSNTNLISGPKHDIQTRLRDLAPDLINALYLDIKRNE